MKIDKDQYFIQDSLLQIMKTKDPQHFMLLRYLTIKNWINNEANI